MFDAETFLSALGRAVDDGGREDGAPLIGPGDGVLVACSGGADSTALALALAALEARDRRGWRLEMAHLHHGLRGAAADGDRDFVCGVAARLGLPFHDRRVDVGTLREAEGGSAEEVGRRERYRFFAEIAETRGLGKVATAHHRDDQLETVVQRLLRGTGIRGLSGIPRRRRLGERAEIVRPFIEFPREEVRGYLASTGVSAREDATNALADGFRNKVRLEVLPYLRGIAPQVDRSLERLVRAASQAHEMIEAETTQRLDAAGIAPSLPLRISLALVRETPAPLRPVLLLRAIERATGDQMLWVHAESLLALAQAPGAGAAVDLPGGVRAVRQYQDIVVERPAAAPPAEAAPVRIAVPGRTEAPALGVAVEAQVGREPAAEADGRRVARFDLASLPGPLQLRHPRPGDFFYPRGGKGRKKLQDFFVDSKVPRAERAQALVLDAGGEVAWIVGFRQDGRFVADEETREALELRVEAL